MTACLALAPAGIVWANDGGTAPEAQPGFSTLDQLTPANVGGLQPVASLPTGSRGAHGTAPVIAGDTAFILTPFPHELLARDLRAPGLPVKWRYRPAADGMAAGQGGGARNAPVAEGGRVFFTTLDGHAIALDAATGVVLWDMRVADLAQGETLRAPPLVARGTVLLGNGGDDFGARGGSPRSPPRLARCSGSATAPGRMRRWASALVSPPRGRGQSRRHHLVALRLAAWRRRCLRPHPLGCGGGSGLSRHRLSSALEPGPAPWRQPLDLRPLCPCAGRRRGPLVPAGQPA
ncbi:PQQ-binding-like beta-propeller repeat protein [Pseudoroseomonas wenyumeiae]